MTTTAVHDIGDLRRLTIALTDAAGAAKDPTTLEFRMRDPAGTETAKTFPADSEVVDDAGAGAFHFDFTPVLAGRHFFRWTAAGAVVLKEAGEFHVKRQQVTG